MWVWSKLSSVKWTDAWEERFYGNPNAVISEIKGGKSIRVEVYCETLEGAKKISQQFGGSVRELKSRDWVAMSAPKSEPLLIRDKLVISQVELGQDEFPDRKLIIVPPEMAFGTGDHPTTATCLRYLVDVAGELDDSWSLLDLGSGSGVLAIAGRQLRAGKVTAFDFDPKAVEVAAQNLERNSVADIDLFEADVFSWQNRDRYQVVVANLFSSVLIEALPLIREWIRDDGHLILSGILLEQWPEVRETAHRNGFTCLVDKPVGKWVTARFRTGS